MKTAGFSVEAPGVKFFRLLAVGVQGTLLLLLLFGPAWRATSNSAAIQSALTVTALFPANGAVGLPIDVPLKITFNAAPSLGASGLIRIRDAATNAVVDTIDLAAASQTRAIAGTVYNYRPVIINGNTALITPHVTLLYNKKYYVTIDAGAFRTATGVFAGIGSSTGWQFNTKPAAPAAGATTLVVASNGTADFATVQGAIDFVPAGNTVRRLISIRRGSYQELIRVNSNKPLITLRGEDRKGTVIAYANNANFNPNSRSVVWVNAADWTIQNLTVRNLTPQGGSQAEAVRTNALRSQIRSCDLYSFQDTLQLNGSAYVENSYIEGDVDFMWGNAAAYFLNCELRNVRSGGYYIQARTPQNQPGFVYVNCRLTGSSGITGAFLARIDPNAFPYSQVVFINSAMGPQVSPAGWLLNNATSSSTIRFWEYRSTDLNGNLLNVSRRIASSRQLTAAQAAQWSNPTFVLGGWVPQAPSLAQSQPVNRTISEAGGPASLAAVPVTGAPSLSPVKLLKQPVGQTVFARNTVAFSVTAQGVPSPSYQWFKDGAPIPGATSPTLVMTAVQPAASGSYTAVAANLVGSVTSKPARLAVFMPGDLIAQQPQRQVVNIGETARLTVKAREPGPIGYQWRKNGADIPGATDSTLTLPDVQPTATGVYTVLVSHLTEATLSAPAILAVTSPTTQLPPLANFVMEGFAGLGQGTTGGGIVDPSDTAHYKVIDASTPNPAQTLQGYLQSAEPLVIELRTDVDLGALNNQNRRPLINPELIASN
ncbi:MAG TPA: pectinesterase family protein, partial [Blastocatellia bacterium]|nr:pectinesterase family protein [Blastocatellia bacterium]